MNILHTADWHIGKQLHKMDLSEDLDLFFDWLLNVITTEAIDLLLVSGDVFDQANPSQSALKQYYGFLKRMIGTNCKIIITGGNHDSAAVLNAPKAILGFLNIEVVGGAPDEISELFFKHSKAETEVVIAAVPFLRDRDIRKSAPGESYSDKVEQIRDGIQNYFATVNTHYAAHYEGCCFIVMGHLYVQGAQVSDSMRDIQIGNQASVKGSIFGEAPNYVALGHIHKPYAVYDAEQVHYSGSPIALSFSERAEVKQVNLISVTGKNVEVKILPIPQFRHLVAFEGTLESVKTQLDQYTHNNQLVSLAEIIVNEPNENVQIRQDFDELQSDHDTDALKIIKSKLNFINKVRGASEAFEPGISVADVTPMEMFEKRLQLDGHHENTEALKNAFRQILEELNL